MTETTSETASLDFELVAQAARLVAPVSSAPVRNRRVFPPPPPPPSVHAALGTMLPLAQPARTSSGSPAEGRRPLTWPSPSDAADLLAWEEAAEQLEPDWATPVNDDEEVAEHTAPLIEASDSPAAPAEAQGAGTPDAIAIVEANIAIAAPSIIVHDETPADERDASGAATQTSGEPAESGVEKHTSDEAESELEALARAVTKNALATLAARAQAPGIPLSAPPLASRAPIPPPPPAAARLPAPPQFIAAHRTPVSSPPTPRPLPLLSPPTSSRPLPPLAPAPSRPPASSAFRAPPVPPPAARQSSVGSIRTTPRAQMPTLPRMADPAPRPALAAPSLLEIRRSPVARRFYAQLGVAAVFGALLATILFALVPQQTTSVSVAASQPASVPAANAPTAMPAKSPEAPSTSDTIPPPPVANVSVDDLEREPTAAAQPRPKTAAPSPPAAAVPAAAKLPAPAPAVEPPSAAKPEAAALAGKGTLHINAVPAANVAIDGRPLGMTPKIVRLSAGTHRVALIGPGGRRSQTVNVAAGRTATVSVKF